jgi:hypothetical protein
MLPKNNNNNNNNNNNKAKCRPGGTLRVLAGKNLYSSAKGQKSENGKMYH